MSTDHNPSSSSSSQALTSVLTVQNKMGIHARPAAMIVRVVNKYPETDVTVAKGPQAINAKSIMGLMMLAAGHGTSLTFTLQGPQSSKVLEEIKNLFARNFDET